MQEKSFTVRFQLPGIGRRERGVGQDYLVRRRDGRCLLEAFEEAEVDSHFLFYIMFFLKKREIDGWAVSNRLIPSPALLRDICAELRSFLCYANGWRLFES